MLAPFGEPEGGEGTPAPVPPFPLWIYSITFLLLSSVYCSEESSNMHNNIHKRALQLPNVLTKKHVALLQKKFIPFISIVR